MDTRTPEQRRKIMQSVGTRNTGPELAVRQVLHGMGYRYGLHRKDLAGSPDIVLTARKKIIFVHGCFWHGHSCEKGKLPKSRTDYWQSKIERNKERDLSNISALNEKGWRTLIVWQCQTRRTDALRSILSEFLNHEKSSA